MAGGGDVERYKRPEIIGCITEFSVRWTRGLAVVGCRLFKIMLYLYRMYFRVTHFSALRVIILVDLLINAYLYELNLGGNEVIYLEFN